LGYLVFPYEGYVSGLSSLFCSVVISSIGFGGSVVAIVQPIQAPINKIATNATNTGTAMNQNLTSAAEPMLNHGYFLGVQS
jgi:hypothetical protein